MKRVTASVVRSADSDTASVARSSRSVRRLPRRRGILEHRPRRAMTAAWNGPRNESV